MRMSAIYVYGRRPEDSTRSPTVSTTALGVRQTDLMPTFTEQTSGDKIRCGEVEGAPGVGKHKVSMCENHDDNSHQANRSATRSLSPHPTVVGLAGARSGVYCGAHRRSSRRSLSYHTTRTECSTRTHWPGCSASVQPPCSATFSTAFLTTCCQHYQAKSRPWAISSILHFTSTTSRGCMSKSLIAMGKNTVRWRSVLQWAQYLRYVRAAASRPTR